MQNQDAYWLQNHPDLIDQAGEWAWQDSGGGVYKIYFWPVLITDLNKTEVGLAGTSGALIKVNGAQGVRLEGFEIAGAHFYGIFIDNSSNITVSECLIRNCNHTGLMVRSSQNVFVTKNVIISGRYGCYIENSPNTTIEYNEIAYNWEDGLRFDGECLDSVVRRNFLHDHICWNHPDNFQTYANYATRLGPKNLHLIENVFLAGGQDAMLESTTDSEFRGNLVIGSYAVAVKFDSGGTCHRWAMSDNTIVLNYMPVDPGDTFDLQENVFMNGYPSRLYSCSATIKYTADRNLFWKSGRSSTPNNVLGWDYTDRTLAQFQSLSGQDINSAASDPQFVNAPVAFGVVEAAKIDQCQKDKLLLWNTPEGWLVNDVIEVNFDGVPRSITNINGKEISFTPAMNQKPLSVTLASNWGPGKTDLNMDFRLKATSPGAHLSATGGAVGSALNLQAFFCGDFNEDGERDIPIIPADWGYRNCVYSDSQSIALTPGWNWISFNVLPADLSLNSVFSSILDKIEQVKAQTQSALRSAGNWKGDLADMNGIGLFKMYKVKVSTACTLMVTGTVIASTAPILLTGGWNWVAYLPTTSMPIATALASINGQVLEVKSLTQSATFNGTTWSGTLTQLAPGQGYAIKMSAPGALTYPAAASARINQQGKNNEN
jgi:parallel beta-helix repeat protein